MAFCMNCGMKVPDNARYCPNCGSKIESSITDTDDGEIKEEDEKKDNFYLTSGHNPKAENAENEFFNAYNTKSEASQHKNLFKEESYRKKRHKPIVICIIIIAAVVILLCVGKIRSGNSIIKHTASGHKPVTSSSNDDYDKDDYNDTDDSDYSDENYDTDDEYADDDFTLKSSDDKHVQYVDKYVGVNASAVGYTSLGGDRLIRIGDGLLTVNYVTEDGSYVGVGTDEDEEKLQDYVVTAQNIAPNTKVKIDFEKDSDGEEYSSLTDFQSYDHIDLAVKKVGSKGNGPKLKTIKAAPDKTKYYIRNYVGKNAATVGYVSLGGDYRDRYGDANIELKLVPEDGSAVDISDTDNAIKNLKKYVVKSQSIKPNTAMNITYDKDVDGLVDSQSFESITLKLKKIG